MSDFLEVLESPWIGIWISPRETIRGIVDADPSYLVLLLAGLWGGLEAMNAALAVSLGPLTQQFPPWVAGFLPLFTLASPFVGAGVGIVSLYVAGFLFMWTGWMLGGTAEPREVRAAVAWSYVPAICEAVITLLFLLASGIGAAFIPSMPAAAADAPKHPALTTAAGLHLIVAIWAFVIFLQCLGEVHRFSAWRSLGAVVMLSLAGAVLAILAAALLGPIHGAV